MSALPELWPPACDALSTALVCACAEGDLLSALAVLDRVTHPTPEVLDSTAGFEHAGVFACAIAALAVQVRLECEAGGSPPQVLARAVPPVAADVGLPEPATPPALLATLRGIARRGDASILVSSLWILVGEAAGLDVRELTGSGGLLLTVDGIPVDPARGGVVLNAEALRAQGVPVGSDRPLGETGLTPARVTARVRCLLVAVRAVCDATDDPIGSYRALALLAALSPTDPQLQLVRARAAEQVGLRADAIAAYRALARVFPAIREGKVAAERAVTLAAHAPLLH